MTLAATSDSVLITTLIIAAIPPTLVAAAGLIIQVINAGKRSEEVAKVLEQGQVIHELVNSAMTDQKRISAKFARRVADTTHDEKDIEFAVEAEKVYQDAVTNAANQPPKI